MRKIAPRIYIAAAVFVFLTSVYLIDLYHSHRPTDDGGIVISPFFSDNRSYLIYTPGCRIPKFSPFDISVKRFYERTPYSYPCPAKKSVFKILDNGGVEILDKDLYSQYKLHRNKIDCYFNPILRDLSTKKPDDHVVLGKKHDMVFGLPIEEDFIKITCEKGNHTVLHDILALTPLKPDVEDECEKSRQGLPKNGEHINVVIVGIDSVSKLNFLRYFKKTFKLLRDKLSAFELRGYNKVADNTYPNLIPFLTGHQRNYYNGKERNFQFFDDVQFVWKEYAHRGYRTMYAEDTPKIGTFVLNRRGFRQPPTHYYVRPFSLYVEGSSLRNHNHCLGNKLEMAAYFDYLRRFIKTMGARPHFSFTFIARLTHDVLKQAGYADKPSFELISDLEKSGTLNNSLLIFFSDHGIRFGDIRNTYVGKIEERMPFMFLIFPEWFLNKYPVFASNLKVNERRLTTPYDIHATLLHLLHLDSTVFFTNHGQSLLTEISPWRTCLQASVSPHWCVCQTHAVVSVTDNYVHKAAEATVRELNNLLVPFNQMCVPLKLEKVLDARVAKPHDEMYSKDDKIKLNYADYLVTVKVSPSAGVFEATVNLKDGRFTVNDEISRINVYGNQSHCIQDSVIRKYCFCRDLLKYFKSV